MALNYDNSVAALADVPASQRQRVLSGMRWSVWLSILAVPCGAAINLLLARVGPETIGVYGLLSVYIALITSFLYFGGDPVVIKFVPECNINDRPAFLASYLLVVLGFAALMVALAYFYPAAVRLVLGQRMNDRNVLLVLALAPMPILFFAVVACLKGMLEIRFAQLLSKLLPITSLVAYAIVFTVHRRLLIADAMFVIWGIYLGITAVLAATGLIQVFRLCGVPPIHFYLPKGFWRYSLDTQQVGLVSFLAGRLDYVLIINFGGLAMLGRYVAVTAVAATVPLMNGLIMDTLLPCLTNMIAARNYNAAVQVFMMHMRILFIVTMASCAVMTVLAVPAAAVMGPKYRSLVSLIILMTILQGIASPGFFGGILLASVGRQRLVNWAGLLYATVFSGLFFPLWHRWGLAGTVVAYGAAAIVSRWALMIIALKTAQIFPSIIVLWAKAALVQTAMGIVVLWCMPFRPFGIALVCIIGGAAFLRITGYSIAEVEALLQTFAPGFARIRTRRSESTREQSPEVAST